jgi:hypothetical protein
MVKKLFYFLHEWFYLKTKVLFKTIKIFGIKNANSFNPYLIEIKSQSGMYLKYAILIENKKPLIVRLDLQDIISVCFNSPILLLDEKREENLLPSNVNIIFFKYRKLSINEFIQILSLFELRKYKPNKFVSLQKNIDIFNYDDWQILKLSQKRSNKIEFLWDMKDIIIVEKEPYKNKKRLKKLLN